MKKGDRIPGLIGWEYHGDPPTIPGLEVVAAGTAWVGGQIAAEVDRDDLPRPQGELRLQRLDDLLGAGPVVAARATRSPGRTGRARTGPTSACRRSRTTCCDGPWAASHRPLATAYRGRFSPTPLSRPGQGRPSRLRRFAYTERLSRTKWVCVPSLMMAAQ